MKFVRGVFFLLSLHITFFKYIYETSAKLFSNALILPILNATYLCRELWKDYLILKPYWKAAVDLWKRDIKKLIP